MADFSEEYCKNWDSRMPCDFSIETVAMSIKDETTYIPMICEGYGFSGIMKINDQPAVIYHMNEYDGLGIKIIMLDELDEFYENTILPILKK